MKFDSLITTNSTSVSHKNILWNLDARIAKVYYMETGMTYLHNVKLHFLRVYFYLSVCNILKEKPLRGYIYNGKCALMSKNFNMQNTILNFDLVYYYLK